jgi:Family of unknown function (DUF5955)
VHGNHNEGVQMSGGRIDAGAFAVGRGATATNTVGSTPDDPGRAEISRRLDELLRQLEAAGPRLDDRAEIAESTQVVAEELGKEHPNKTTVTGVLTGIAGAVASVTGLATATDALLGAVKQCL